MTDRIQLATVVDRLISLRRRGLGARRVRAVQPTVGTG